jgi:hypothetical protein
MSGKIPKKYGNQHPNIVPYQPYNAKNGKFIKHTLEEVISSKGTEYLLNVENLKKEKGRYFDVIVLKTTSRIRPEINIGVFGDITDQQELRKTVPTRPQRLQDDKVIIKNNQKKQEINESNLPADGNSLKID